MSHSITQRGIDAGLPARPCCLECVKNIRVDTHIQGGALHWHDWPATATFDAGLLPLGRRGGGVVGVIRAISSSVG